MNEVTTEALHKKLRQDCETMRMVAMQMWETTGPLHSQAGKGSAAMLSHRSAVIERMRNLVNELETTADQLSGTVEPSG